MASTPAPADRAPASIMSCKLMNACRDVSESSEPQKPYPPMSSIPRTPDARLRAPPTTPTSVLYLAYGSNLCAETLLGVRQIRPISRITVSAPTLDLVFDLPGIPYLEPCFANSAVRKEIPKLPDPTNPPKIPPFDPPTPSDKNPSLPIGEDGTRWTKGLIGVVYEVTPEDYDTILATEGNGASYKDILVPCFAIPPRMSVPEKPPIELPKPFFAHTLFAPSIPDELPGDPDKPKDPKDLEEPPKDDARKWYWRFLKHPYRAPGYAQPSPRYLTLIRNGAKENELPDDYQAYLATLQPYTITSWRQSIGRLLFLVPFLIAVFIAQTFSGGARSKKIPAWVTIAVSVFFNLVWMGYDAVLKPLLGDGEHTQKDDKDERKGWLGQRCTDEEKRSLLAQDDEI
ncbi:hypothetical protein B0T11DRAFT_276938 [Plectosphaerella cucumerina]|uniref:gamma-glutamylcyclotransferase n=1 Tax=Plectosphaerella cucumerina TaxID=40658 RepID=A0A8K0TND4_9PEZI|nr:hypothetical protein B0T11DRAFT_276938 [Plectosphaerella cucumerina]